VYAGTRRVEVAPSAFEAAAKTVDQPLKELQPKAPFLCTEKDDCSWGLSRKADNTTGYKPPQGAVGKARKAKKGS